MSNHFHLLLEVRYFTDGAVIGSKAFVNETFEAARELAEEVPF